MKSSVDLCNPLQPEATLSSSKATPCHVPPFVLLLLIFKHNQMADAQSQKQKTTSLIDQNISYFDREKVTSNGGSGFVGPPDRPLGPLSLCPGSPVW